MGVEIQEEEVHEKLQVECPRICTDELDRAISIDLHLTEEDDNLVWWAGACSACGASVQLVMDKEDA